MIANDKGNLNLAELVASEAKRFPGHGPQQSIKSPEPEAAAKPDTAPDAAQTPNPRLSKEVKTALALMPPTSAGVISAVGERASCNPQFDDADFENVHSEILAYQVKFQAAIDLAMKHTPRHAAIAYRAHKENLAAKVMTADDVEGHEVQTLEHWEANFRFKMQSAISLSKTYSAKVRELVLPYISRYVETVREYADQVALNEQNRCESIRIPWKPTEFLLCLYKAAETVETHAGRGASPKDCAAFLNIFGK